MSLFREILAEMVGMFLSDARLTFAVLALVAAVAVNVRLAGLNPLIAGAVLTVGCIAVLIENIRSTARAKAGE